jgi:hypothetical protein
MSWLVEREWVLEPNLLIRVAQLGTAINHQSRILLLQIHLSKAHCQILAIKIFWPSKIIWPSKISWPSKIFWPPAFKKKPSYHDGLK